MLKPELLNDCVEIRRSMIKFDSEYMKLEVIRCATYSQGFLNRQIIRILSCQGVNDELILEKLEWHLKLLNSEETLDKCYGCVLDLEKGTNSI